MKLKFSHLLKPLGTIIQQNYWSFYPSEPFTLDQFNMIHPVLKCTFLVQNIKKLHCLAGEMIFWITKKRDSIFQIQKLLFIVSSNSLMSIMLSLVFIGPKLFWTIQINLFWSDANHFGQVQIISVRVKLDISGLIFIIWTWPKWIGLDQNDLEGPK